MLIQKLKQYPKHSQYMGGASGPGAGPGQGASGQGSSTSGPGDQYTPGGEYQLPDGTDYIGTYHTRPNGTAYTGLTADANNNQSQLLTPIVSSGGATTTVGNALVLRDYGGGGTANYQTGYTSGGEYTLPDGTDFVGNYHIMSSGIVMAGVQHNVNSAVLTPVPIASAQDLMEYEHYIESGSTYKSNLSYVNLRDSKGIISYQQDGNNNNDVIIELVTSNFKNRSVISAIDTQFQYFKFPAQISTTIDDLTFDESLLDIDVQQGILNDPYQGKLIRNISNWNGGLYFVQGTEKRRFNVKAGSIWALKNNLPPFENIVGNIPGKDEGENNYSANDGNGNNLGYHDVTYKLVPPGIYDGYTTGDPYEPEDAFSEGNVYAKATFTLRSTDPQDFPSGLVNNSIEVGGPSFGGLKWSSIDSTTFADNGTKRHTEFDINEMQTSYIGISSNLAQGGGVTQMFANTSYAPSWRSAIQTNIGFDVEVGTSYLDFVQEAFRDWAMGIGTWNITQLSTSGWDSNTSAAGTKPRNYLNDIRSTTPGESETHWGAVNKMYYPSRDNDTNELQETPWYRLKVPLNETTYTLLFDGNNITDKLHNSNMTSVSVLSSNPFNGIPFVDVQANPGEYNGYRLNFADILPNGLSGNTAYQFEIVVNSLNQSEFILYFIGLNYDDTGASNTDRTRNVVVPNSISVMNPRIGFDGNKTVNKKDRLKNVEWGQGANSNASNDALSSGVFKNWDNNSPIHTGNTFWSP